MPDFPHFTGAENFVFSRLKPVGTPPRKTRHSLRWRRCAFCLGSVLLVAVYAHARGVRSHHGSASADSAPITSGGQDTEKPSLSIHGMRRPGYLGVSLRDLDAAEATRLHKRGAMGAMIVTVDRDAPAWSAGLRPQDVVLEMNGQAIDGVEMLRRRLRECPANDTITLRVRRGDEEMSFSVMLGDQDTVAQNALTRHFHPAPAVAAETEITPPGASFASDAPPPPAPSANSRGVASTLLDALIPGATYTGLEVDPLTPQLAAFFGAHANVGLLVTAVNGGSPAANAGLVAGDVIIRAGNQPVSTRSGLAKALRGARGNAVPLAVLREHKEVILSLLPAKRRKL